VIGLTQKLELKFNLEIYLNYLLSFFFSEDNLKLEHHQSLILSSASFNKVHTYKINCIFLFEC
jgi:hypothetical protein